MRHFLFFFEPDTQQKTVRIPVRGYNFVGLLMGEDPGCHYTHVVRVRDLREQRQFEAWHRDWRERFHSRADVIILVDETSRCYWEAVEHVLKNPRSSVRAQILSVIAEGAIVRPFDWTDRIGGVLEPLEHVRCYGRITSRKRHQCEYRIKSLMDRGLLPSSMMAERFTCRGSHAVAVRIHRIRASGTHHPIEVSLEGSVGGMGTVLIPSGVLSTPELEQLFRESGERVYDIVVRYPGQTKWSVQYEVNDHIRRIGMSEKRFVITPDGRDIHAASVMAERLRSIPASHIRKAERVNRRIVSDAVSRGQGGSMGFVWRSVPGNVYPELLWRTMRDESETVAHSLLRQLKRRHRRAFVAVHTRIFFRAMGWHDIHAKLGNRLLCTLEHPTGVVAHFPYFKNILEQTKLKHGIQTLLCIAIGRSTGEAERISQNAIERLGAWRQGENEQ